MAHIIWPLLETALNGYLRLDPDAALGLLPLEERSVMIELRGTGLSFCLSVEGQAFRVRGHCPQAPDAWIRGTPRGFLRLGAGQGGARPLFEGEVVIEGDTDVGQRFRAVLEAVEIDWEELLSKAVGDVAAHQIGNLVRDLGAWMHHTRAALEADAEEYLHEEARLLPSRLEIEDFLEAVDTLRSDVDRLDARVRRLEARIASPTVKPDPGAE